MSPLAPRSRTSPPTERCRVSLPNIGQCVHLEQALPVKGKE